MCYKYTVFSCVYSCGPGPQHVFLRKHYVLGLGHVYGIGDCGQAMVKSRCPECKEEIGGERHLLVGTSQRAVEMTSGRAESPPDPFVVRYL